MPSRYAAGLAHRAHRFFAHSPRHRRRWIASPEAGRDWLYVFMRHWLAGRLYRERPALYTRLPARYAVGEPPPVVHRPPRPPVPLSNEARLLLAM